MKSLSFGIALSLAFSFPAVAQSADGNLRIAPEGVWYTVSRDETLSSISRKFTGDIRHWRAIGNTNQIDNEKRIPVGRIVLIPAALLTPVSAFARITSFFGEIAIHDRDGNPIEAKIDTLLKEGDTLVTMARSFISLALEDGSQVTLPPDSMLNLRMLRATQYLNSPRTRLFLEKGRVESSVTPFTRPDSRYEVLSPMAVSGVRGTRFRVQYREQRTLNEVIEGKVAVQPGETVRKSGGQLVAAGFGTIVENGRTAKPVHLLPAPAAGDGYARQERLPIRFQLSRAEASAFHARVSTDAQGTNNIAETDATATDGTTVVRFADLPDGHYFLHVHAVDRHGLGGIVQTVPFEVAARPFPPFLLSPGNRFQGSGNADLIAVTMQWSLSGNVTRYRLQVAQDAGFGQPEIDQTVEAGEQDGRATVSLPPGLHHWRVAAIDAQSSRQGPFSDAREVNVIQGLSAPAATLGEKDIHFTWSSTAAGQRFTFQLAADAAFTQLLHEADTAAPEATLPRPQPGTYHARVRSIDADGFIGPYSPPQRFVVPLVWQSGYGLPVQSQEQPLGTDF